MPTPEEMSRTERKRAAREAKQAEKEKAEGKQKAAHLTQKVAVYGVAILLAAGVAYWGYGRLNAGSPGEFIPSLGNLHVSEAEAGLTKYNSDPPTSGPHFPMVARWGIHEQPVTKELQVHNLEDGGVVVQYNCAAPSEECKTLVAKLTSVVLKYDHVILAPYPGLSDKIALTAWTRIDKFNDFDENRIARFIESYIHIDHHPAK
jgi:hypothetical protein